MTIITDLKQTREELGELVERHSLGRDLGEFERFADDPVVFAREVLGVDLWSAQREIATAVQDHDLVAVRSGNSVGKDFTAAVLSLWWTYAIGGYVLLTGPTERQVKEILMAEIRNLFTAAKDLPGSLFQMALRVGHRRGILAFTSSEVSRVTGFHAPRVLAIVTEAQGVEEFCYEGLLRCATGENDRVLAAGNPVMPSGRFYSIHRPNSGWHTIKISALDHPNLVHDRTVIPGGPTRAGVERLMREYGKGSPIYAYSVLGEFPEDAEESLVKRAWLEEASRPGKVAELRHVARRTVYALDVARFGDDKSALARWTGPILLGVTTWHGADTMETTGKLVAELTRRGVHPPYYSGRVGSWTNAPERVAQRADIVIDTIGLGAGVTDRLVEIGYMVDAFNSSAKPRDDRRGRFLNRRAEAYWVFREVLERGEIAMPPDESLFEELLATQWLITSAGKIQIEAKQEIKSRLGRSPDRADAVVMGFSRVHKRSVPRCVRPVTWSS